jgi:large subunit ribosomal protein L21
MSYAIISLGGKQYRVREGERLLVDRLPTEDGKTFTPGVLLVGGNGTTVVAPKDVTVTVKVLGQQRGPKIRIGKYKKRTGYKRHTGFRAALTQIEVESISGKKARVAKPKAEAAVVETTAEEVVGAVVEAPAEEAVTVSEEAPVEAQPESVEQAPEAEAPVAKKRATRKPAAEAAAPAVKKPAARKPAAKKPVAKKPATGKEEES